MGKKIFVSYKYSDNQVQDLNLYEPTRYFAIENRHKIQTTARHYVDKLDELLEKEDHIFKGEDDGEDMGTLADATIGSKLGDKIFDSSITIVLISKGMNRIGASEKDQWIPWEISYSLKEQSREGICSKTNAVLAVVLPDQFGRYDYFIQENTCPHCNCRTLKTDFLFPILRNNMFNVKNPIYTDCEMHVSNRPYSGFSSFIHSVKWSDFSNNPNKYIDIATNIRARINEYNITKVLK